MGFIVDITFHRAENTPIGDLSDLSSDPFILSTVSTLGSSEELFFRTPTVIRSLNPEWNSQWRIAGVPKNGFVLDMLLMDQDNTTRDDKLGRAIIDFTASGLKRIKDGKPHVFQEGYEVNDMECKLMKRKGSVRTHVGTYFGSMIRKNISRHGRIFISVKVIGTDNNEGGAMKPYTIGPHVWSQHYSPLLGRVVHTKVSETKTEENGEITDSEDRRARHPKTASSAFQANKIQLAGPVPPELYHRYVDFAPFVTSLFNRKGLRGQILNHGIHKQHRIVYSYNTSTVFGHVPTEKGIAEKFLDMTSWGEGGRTFTYVIMLDGQWRFTETGEEFTIQFLSKHTMHSDAALFVAFSGEFLVLRKDKKSLEKIQNGDVPETQARPGSPKDYELVIDNDSGTYRPNKDFLPILQKFLEEPENLGGLGGIRAMDGFDDELKKLKERQQEVKKAMRGKEVLVQVQRDSPGDLTRPGETSRIPGG